MKVNTKIFFALIQAMLSAGFAFAQPYSNEWVVPGQTYYKIPVGKTGLYALSYSDIPSGTDPRKMQIWRRGVEQAIIVKGESDGSFDPADSLFFYGEINDGVMDAALYLTPALQPHQYYSLYTDTSAYFLTWASSGPVKRMVQLNASSTSQPAAPFHINEELMLFTNTYDEGRPYSLQTYLSEFDMGEGWFGNAYTVGQSFSATVNASGFYPSGPLPQLEIMLVGRNNNNQSVEILIGNNSIDTIVNFSGHSTYKFNASLAFNISPSLPITFKPLSVGGANGYVSLAYIRLNFPQSYNVQGQPEKYITLPQNPQDTTFIQISNPSLPAYIFDITDKNNIRQVSQSVQAGLLNAIIPGTDIPAGRKLYVSSAVMPVTGMKTVDLSGYDTTGNYIIVSHANLAASSTAYAAYRSSVNGGGHKVVLSEINKLYNLFSYGDKSPLAIRHFADYLLDHGKPQYLLLLGKGVSVNSNNNANGAYYRTNPVAYKTVPDPYYYHLIDDLIPPAGYPGSDILYTMGLDPVLGAYMPAIATGRIAARNDAEVMDYLNKVIEHETGIYADSNWLWRKNLIHLSGGDDAGQINAFKTWISGSTMKGVAEGPNFGGKVVKTFTKESPGSVDDSFRSSVADEVNKGVSYITFLGHASPAITDVDLGFVSYPIYGYQNKGKYPMLLLNGCSSSNVFNYYSFSEDWILTPDKGAVAVIGHTDIGYPDELEAYSQDFYKTAFVDTNFIDKPVGLIQKKLLSLFIAAQNPFYDQRALATIEQMILHGDPAIRIYHPSKPDYS
ncbi:MAG TPA: C25 family cysteine peptidase, partial [Cytophagaceae bacterium]|nr:C25 family cysteine peptidase [Cytophagaceae bacterium]